jgi:hypothetical protein
MNQDERRATIRSGFTIMDLSAGNVDEAAAHLRESTRCQVRHSPSFQSRDRLGQRISELKPGPDSLELKNPCRRRRAIATDGSLTFDGDARTPSERAQAAGITVRCFGISGGKNARNLPLGSFPTDRKNFQKKEQSVLRVKR